MKRRFAFDFTHNESEAPPVPPLTPRNGKHSYEKIVEENEALRARVFFLEQQNKHLINHQTFTDNKLHTMQDIVAELNKQILELKQETKGIPYAP